MITASGMVTALGREADTSCAAARAGLLRLSGLHTMNFAAREEFGQERLDGFPAVVGHVAPLVYGYTGPVRLAVLGGFALGDLLQKRPVRACEASTTAMFLALPDAYLEKVYATAIEAEEPVRYVESKVPDVAELILSRAGLALPERNRRIYREGHVGFARALADASAEIGAGVFQQCIVGAVDCCLDPAFLEAAASLRALRTGSNPVGFLPGEAAAFILLERPGASTGVQLNAVGFANGGPGEFDEAPLTGQHLAKAIAAALEGSRRSAPLLDCWIADLNGTERRAMDWGHAVVRLRSRYDLPDIPLWTPAASFGETGAASGAVAVCVALKAYERGYMPGPNCLIWLASHDGGRAAILLVSGN